MSKEKKKILFVCLGNICRSPAAEGVMKHLVREAKLENRIEIDSAGTYGGHAGNRSDSRMRSAASERGYSLDSRARQIKMEDFWENDLIIVMDESNLQNVSRLAPDVESQRKIKKMVSYSRKFRDDHVPDPYYGGTDGFEHVLDLLEDACRGLLESIQEELKV